MQSLGGKLRLAEPGRRRNGPGMQGAVDRDYAGHAE